MKILLQNQYDGPLGGVETYFQLLIKALLEKGHEVVTLYTFRGKNAPVRTDKFKAFYLPDLDLSDDLYFSGKRDWELRNSLTALKAIVEKEKPDVIHLNNTYYPSQFEFLRKYAPLVQTVHDFFNTCPILLKMFPDAICTKAMGAVCFKENCVSVRSIRELWRFKTKFINREAMKRFDKLLVTTEFMKRMLVCNGFEEGKVEALPLFVEDWKCEVPPQEDTLLYVGRLTKEKGVLHFIHMLKLLDAPFTAYVIGDGPQREECECLVKNMGLEEKVVFTGFLERPQLREFFAKATLVVVPSLWPEPFCLVGLEAMSSSRPVVAYNVGGISSWLKENMNGYLAERGNLRSLTSAVEMILKNKKLGLTMGEKGRRMFEDHFTEKTHFPKLFAVYEALAKEKKAAGKRFFKFRVDFFPRNSSGLSASKRGVLDHYPNRLLREPLPEYNKRVIAYEIKNHISVVRSYPEEITISTTTRCNMQPPCVICERNERTVKDEEDLDGKTFKILKPIFKYADRIYLHCGGEPLITKRSYEIIESVSPPTKIIFNTNGALFTEKTIRYMVDCGVVDVISFSIDAATEKTYKRIRSANFDKIIHNIKTLIEYRNARNKSKPLLRPLVLMNFCIFKQNIYEVPDYVELAHRLGADGIDFSHMNEGFTWKQQREGYLFEYQKEHVLNMESKEDHDVQIVKAYELGKKFNMPINFNGNPFIGTLDASKGEAKKELSEVIRLKKTCIAPWSRVVIETDGRVRMCYFHDNKQHIIGKLKATRPGFETRFSNMQSRTFEELWNGEDAVSVREEFIRHGIAERCVSKNPCIFQDRI